MKWLSAAVGVALIAGCTSGGSAPTGEETETSTTTDLPAVTLACGAVIDLVDEPPPVYTVVLDVVAIPTNDSAPTALQTADHGVADRAARLFAKTGLLVRTGGSFQLSVPAEMRDRMSIGWGSPAARTWDLEVPGCEGTTGWMVFAGGFWVRDPGCVALNVHSGDDVQQVTIGVGAPCAGQDPPPEPTDY